MVYVYGRLLFEWVDVGHALLNLEGDLQIDAGVLIGASALLEDAVAAAEDEDEDPALWEVATRPLILGLMGLNGDNDASDMPPSDDGANKWVPPPETPAGRRCFGPKSGGWSTGDEGQIVPADRGGIIEGETPKWRPPTPMPIFPCDDGNPCTYDKCVFREGSRWGVCVHRYANGKRCQSDGNVCTKDVCWNGTCTHHLPYPPPPRTCDDGDPCTVYDQCVGTICTGTEMNCEDYNVCTEDFCVVHPEGYGMCAHTAINENMECGTLPPVCWERVCVGGSCTLRPKGGPCEDGDYCTVNDFCSDGLCTPGSPRQCPDDGNVCTDDVCVDQACRNLPNSGLCDDGNFCTVDDFCSGGVCNPGPERDCTDDNPCTDDDCLESACVHTANNDPCEDDGNPCTYDECTGGQCVHAPHSNPYVWCNDGDSCTVEDRCVDGTCIGTRFRICEDDNPCTDNGCVGQGCEFTYNTAPCNDEDPCTENDHCSGGTCSGTAKDCDDDNPCTINHRCDPQ